MKTLTLTQSLFTNPCLRALACGCALCLLLVGCAQQPSYQLAHSQQQIKHLQVLDPAASARNDGFFGGLQGNYGKKVVDKYQDSVYDMKESRVLTQKSQN
jgi:hypothetical protein